jgi:hypothetical protein
MQQRLQELELAHARLLNYLELCEIREQTKLVKKDSEEAKAASSTMTWVPREPDYEWHRRMLINAQNAESGLGQQINSAAGLAARRAATGTSDFGSIL